MLSKKVNGWLDTKNESKIFKFADEYKEFLNENKTEHNLIANAIKLIEKKGFKNFEKVKKLKYQDKVYFKNSNKNLILAIIGKNIEEGFNMIASHIDAPRIDLKPNPLYEENELALFKTRFYGGIKKYQWVSLPLALHGEIILKNGKKIEIKIGENENDPIFCIPDILPHLDRTVQRKRTSENLIAGEELRILVGSQPYKLKKIDIKEKVKYTIMKYLNDNYKIEEDDFSVAELQIVPALKAKDVGFDRALIGGYGQDDRICAFTSINALLELDDKNITKTAIAYLVDKEEIGSFGSTSLDSNFLELCIGELIEKITGKYNENILRRIFWKSHAICADVTGAINPIFKSAYEPQNAAKLNYGVNLSKYTGGAGKYHSSDANLEFIGELKKIFNENNVKYQFSELGKVEEGGGGTFAMHIEKKGIKTIDMGPSLLSMHSPFEISSKFDLYHTFLAYLNFYKI